MPKQYRVVVSMQDEDGNEIGSSSYDEVHEDDQEAVRKLEEKAKAARDSGKGER